MSKKPSSENILREIAGRTRGLQEGRAAMMGPMTALDAFIGIDPVLGALNKALLDARTYRDSVVEQHGADAPMAEVAADMVDSADSAFRTRLIEVRQNPEIRREAVKIVRAQQADIRQETGKQGLLARIGKIATAGKKTLPSRAQKQGEDSFSNVMVHLLALQQALRRSQKMLSLAAAFSAANPQHREAAHA
jgi:hypothetical protein